MPTVPSKEAQYSADQTLNDGVRGHGGDDAQPKHTQSKHLRYAEVQRDLGQRGAVKSSAQAENRPPKVEAIVEILRARRAAPVWWPWDNHPGRWRPSWQYQAY